TRASRRAALRAEALRRCVGGTLRTLLRASAPAARANQALRPRPMARPARTRRSSHLDGRRGLPFCAAWRELVRRRVRSNTQRERLQGTPEAATDRDCSERQAPRCSESVHEVRVGDFLADELPLLVVRGHVDDAIAVRVFLALD